MYSKQLYLLHRVNHSLTSKFYFSEVKSIFAFKNSPHAEVTHLLNLSCETQKILIEIAFISKICTSNRERKTTLEELVSVKIRYTPHFFRTIPYFTNPSLFMGKIWTLHPPILGENFGNSTPALTPHPTLTPLYTERGSNYARITIEENSLTIHHRNLQKKFT